LGFNTAAVVVPGILVFVYSKGVLTRVYNAITGFSDLGEQRNRVLKYNIIGNTSSLRLMLDDIN
jgi:hypothetical protein